MSARSISIVVVLMLVTAIAVFNVATAIARTGQQSAVALPTAAMLREIVKEMESGNHARAMRMTRLLEHGLDDHLHRGGPSPERFIGEVYAVE